MGTRVVAVVGGLLAMACATTAAGDGGRVRCRAGQRCGGAQTAQLVAAGGGANAIDVQAALQNGTLLQGADGQTYLGVWIQAPELQGAAGHRPPMAMSLVIDRSGSMAGDKIINARMAAQSFVSRMRNGDILSIFAYDDTVMQVFGPAVLEPASREIISARLAQLQPGGSTNIHGGLTAAQAALVSAPATHPLRRTILISDGLANVGPSSPDELANVGARGTDLGIQVTTIGVGMDYDERMMVTLAMRGAGRFYHLAESAQMASILSQELELLDRTVASGAVLEIVPADGIRILGAEGLEVRREGQRVVLPLGALHSRQRREVLLRVQADTSAPGARSLGSVRLRYADADGSHARAQDLPVQYRVSDSRSAAEGSRNDRVVGMVQQFAQVQAQQQASTMLTTGDRSGAAQVLRQHAAQMRASAAPLAAPVRAEVERRARRLESQGAEAESAASAPAARGSALNMADEAADALGL